MSEQQEEHPLMGIAGKITGSTVRPDGVREITDMQLESVSLASVKQGLRWSFDPVTYQWKSNDPVAIAWTVAWVKCLHLDRAVTFDAVQETLERLYRDDRTDPSYLFLAEQDQDVFEQSVTKYTPYRGDAIVQFLNGVTGRLMHLVVLPGLPQRSIMLGFFEQ